MAQIARIIQQCKETKAVDGLVYNVCILPLDCSLAHRLLFAQNRADELNHHSDRPLADPCEVIAASLACHVDVLMRTGGFMAIDL